MAGVNPRAKELVVWIDSQTDEEIKRGVREAFPIPEKQGLIDSAYMRAIEDWLLGMNFSRGLSVRYARTVSASGRPIAVGRVMTAVLGMVVRRELEIRDFTAVPFYKVQSSVTKDGQVLTAGWKCTEKSPLYGSDKLYDASGFKTEADAKEFAASLPAEITVTNITKTEKKKYAPLLFSLAELQIECAKVLHLTPQQTLDVAQSLYEKKMTTYPRTDARVLTTAVAKVISGNLRGLKALPGVAEVVDSISNPAAIANTRYTDDSKVTDHYAIIPTGQNVGSISSLSSTELEVYRLIVKRFLSIFLPPAVYTETKVTEQAGNETFTVSGSVLTDPGYLTVAGVPENRGGLPEAWNSVKKGDVLSPASYSVIAGETKPPKRYTEGSIVSAMEGAGKLIEDEELRAQISGSGIGTSATRAATIEKLKRNGLIQSEKKTLILTPTGLGFRNYEVVRLTVPSLLSPEMTAEWERDLDSIAQGKKTKAQYEQELNDYIKKTVEDIKTKNVSAELTAALSAYPDDAKPAKGSGAKPAYKVNAACYLNVPWDDKDTVKALGARFDGERKSWYVPKGTDPAPFAKWAAAKTSPKASSIKKVYLKVPYADKDKAKALGARFDGEKKQWYYTSDKDASLFAAWK
jgi:DNA topoisomerase-3